MRTRTAALIILLVILPTAFLALLAGRTLQSWGLILHGGMQEAAVAAIDSAVTKVHASLLDDLRRVNATMAEAVAAGAGIMSLQESSQRLAQRGVVAEVLLFVNPWGFMLPVEESGGSPVPLLPGSGSEALATPLRRAIATAGDSAEVVRFSWNDAAYLFSPVRESKGLYAGYRVSPDRFEALLSRRLAEASMRGITLVAEGPGLSVGPPRRPPPAELVVEDSLAGDPRVLEPGEGNGESILTPEEAALQGAPLASGRLYRPFDYVQVTAYVSNPSALLAGGRVRARLYGWGILLLVAVIALGTGLALLESAREIRKATTKSDFLIGISHDLRTPVASMKMLAESLLLDHVPDPVRQKQFIGVMARESDRLTHMIERVLFFVRFDRGTLQYRFREVSAEDLVRQSVETFLASAGAVGTTAPVSPGIVRVRVPDGLPTLVGDENALGQVLLNLLDNAWKYGAGGREGGEGGDGFRVQEGREGGDGQAGEVGAGSSRPSGQCCEPAIEVTACCVERRRRWIGPRRRWVQVSVRDYGPGIPAREQRRIFRRFYRTPGAAGANVSGVGLGLTLCRHVVTEHGGWIEVDSREGEGSTFSVFLPGEVKSED